MRGVFEFEKAPTGRLKVWVWALGREVSGPFECEVNAARTTHCDVVAGPRLPVVSVFAEARGQPCAWLRLYFGDRDRNRKEPFDRRFEQGPGNVLTMDDGWAHAPLPPGEGLVAFRSAIHVDQSHGWLSGIYDSPIFAETRIDVPKTGHSVVRVSLDWRVYVSHVERERSGWSAGFRPDDIIEAWDGRSVDDWSDCRQADHPIKVRVKRDGKPLELTLPPGRNGVVTDRLYFKR